MHNFCNKKKKKVRLLKQKWHSQNLNNNNNTIQCINATDINSVTLYPNSFTNTLRSKFNNLKSAFYVYKGIFMFKCILVFFSALRVLNFIWI